MSVDGNAILAVLAVAGIVAAILYVAIVLVGAAIRPGYSHVANAVSELVEAGAPDRARLNLAFLLYNALSVAFGIAIVVLAANAVIAASGWLLVATGAAGIVMGWFPMDPIGQPATLAGRGHLVLAGMMSVGTMAAVLALAIGAASLPGWGGFSTYSFVTFGVIFITGLAAALSAARRWRTMGLWERLTIGTFLQWMAVLAIALLRS